MSLPKKDWSGNIFIENVQETITRRPLGNWHEEISTSGRVTYIDISSNQTYTVTLSEFTHLIWIKTYQKAYEQIERTYKEVVDLMLSEMKSHNRPNSSSE